MTHHNCFIEQVTDSESSMLLDVKLPFIRVFTSYSTKIFRYLFSAIIFYIFCFLYSVRPVNVLAELVNVHVTLRKTYLTYFKYYYLNLVALSIVPAQLDIFLPNVQKILQSRIGEARLFRNL